MTTPLAAFSFLDPAYRRDPYPVLARLRAADPVHRSPFGWIVTRHADVARLNRDPRLGRDTRKLRSGGLAARASGLPGFAETLATWMFHLDPPEHGRIRRLFAHAFTPRAIERMIPAVERVAGALLDGLPESGDVELMERFARPLPVAVICAVMDVPAADHARIARWSDAIAEQVEVTSTPAQLAAGDVAYGELKAYLVDLVAARRADPGTGLIDDLIRAEADGGALSSDELLANIVLLLVAGHETTTNLIGNGVKALLEHPDQLALLRRRPELAAPAVEECLRFDSPVNTNGRCALEDLEVGGQRIRAGHLVICMLGAANRDPAVFADPDRLDITRDPNPHQSFGGGPHHCLGAPLARLEGRIALRGMLDRYRELRLGAARWRDRINLRGLSELRLEVQR